MMMSLSRKARKDCHCSCHRTGAVHVVACCDGDPIPPAGLEKLFKKPPENPINRKSTTTDVLKDQDETSRLNREDHSNVKPSEVIKEILKKPKPWPQATLLNKREEQWLQSSGQLWNDFLKLDDYHPDEKQEMRFHIHAIQHMVMSRAARRARPDLFFLPPGLEDAEDSNQREDED